MDTPGEFIQGAVHSDSMAMAHEKPAHKVSVSGFYIDRTEVTNAQFQSLSLLPIISPSQSVTLIGMK